jgi:hypothetical protein
MSVQREELLRLVEELPEDEVPVVLDDVVAISVLSGAAPGLRRGPALVRAGLRMWRLGPRSCSEMASAARRDHLRDVNALTLLP